MNGYGLARFFLVGLGLLALAACGERPIDVEALKKEPKRYVGSDTCKLCHLEHYDSWKMTLPADFPSPEKVRDSINVMKAMMKAAKEKAKAAKPATPRPPAKAAKNSKAA